LIAGLTVALFTIPQAMAYALIAGFPPSAGITTAIVASILGAAFGSSEFLVNGPTNAISVVLGATLAVHASRGNAIEQIVVITLLTGIIQFVGAAFRLGTITRFVSEPVLAGFTAGAGIYIAVNQLPAVLGLQKAAMVKTFWNWVPPQNCLFDFARTMASLPRAHWVTFAFGIGTFALVRVLFWLEPRTGRRLPAPFITVVVMSIVAYFAPGAGLKLVKDIQPIAREIPHFVMPVLRFPDVFGLLGTALAISVIGSVEAIAIGKLLAARVGHPFSASRQLVGEGLCNIGAALVGGFASSGSFTRTAVIFDSGAVTRLSVIFSGALVLVLVVLFAPAANYVPIAVLAGTLIHVGLKLVNVVRLKLLLQTTAADRTVLLTTFAGVLLMPQLEYALFIGIGMAVFQALHRAEGFKLVMLKEDLDGKLTECPVDFTHKPELVIIDVQGELFFASADGLKQRLYAVLRRRTRFIVLRLAHAYNMDATCAEAVGEVAREAQARGGRLILADVKPGMYGTLERAGIVDELGRDTVFRHEPTLLSASYKAIRYAETLLAESTVAQPNREARA
jgi:SulP family sulfate permease